jgi:hypothetical protein
MHPVSTQRDIIDKSAAFLKKSIEYTPRRHADEETEGEVNISLSQVVYLKETPIAVTVRLVFAKRTL